jgi:hypothetical protein
MPTELQSDNKGLWAQQDKGAYLDYGFDWSDWLPEDDTIATSIWTTDAGLTLNSGGVVGAETTIWVQGGTADTWYAVSNKVTSAQGRQDVRTFRLFIYDGAAPITAQDGSALFPNRFDAVSELRRDGFLLASQNYFAGVELSDDFLWNKLRAAEAEIGRRLRVPLQPTQFFPVEPTQAQIDALNGMPWEVDPPYDYEPDMFQADRWGFIVARKKPLIAVQKIELAYPAPSNSIYTIPSDWIRMDKKYGHIRLVPASAAITAPLSTFLIQALSGGRMVPFMVQVTYTAGLTNVAANWPDLVDAVKKLAILKIIEDGFIPQSGSISADGLSQSMSSDMDKHYDIIDRIIDGPKGSNGGLMAAIHGVRSIVMG